MVAFSRYYTLADVAKITGLTSRTIHNYLKDGKLQGKKVGAQWRFTEDNIKALFSDGEVFASLSKAHNKIALDYIDGESNHPGICTVVDLPCSDPVKIEPTCQKVVEAVNLHKEHGSMKMSYVFYEELQKARFIFIGDYSGVIKVLNILQAAESNLKGE